ncbi:mitochondrial ribosomal protein S25 [Hyaloraphidium curvatum]|nr:mitochondrial ribosomal protein S25 [Hyaloraphidium curvatum]
MPRRLNPVALANIINDFQAAGIVKEKPVWHTALQLYPPGPSPTRSLTPGMTFRPPSSGEGRPLFPPRKAQRRLAGQLMVRWAQQRPPRIEYPEDALRRRFYGEHPFELVARPATLVEDEGLLRQRATRTWDSVEGAELNGEAVIKHALYLKSTGMEMKDAYTAAVKAYRLARAREEEEQLERMKAKFPDGEFPKPATERFIKQEQMNLDEAADRDREFRERRMGGQQQSRPPQQRRY